MPVRKGISIAACHSRIRVRNLIEAEAVGKETKLRLRRVGLVEFCNSLFPSPHCPSLTSY